MRKSMILDPRGPKIDQNGAQERSKSDIGSKSFSRATKSERPGCFFWAFWRDLRDFWRHLVPSWAPRGSQNRAFWHQDAPKRQKMTSRMRHQKKYEFSIEFLSENMRFWRCWTLPNALYIGISVVFADYNKIENFLKIDAQMDPKNHLKIDVWALRGPTFEVFGNILRNAIFWWFLKCVKIDQKQEKFDTLSPEGRPEGIFG